jgi:acetate kinase
MSSEKILVANIGSTSFKFRLFEMPSENVVAEGKVERIGDADSPWKLEVGENPADSGSDALATHQDAIRLVAEKLKASGIDLEQCAAFGFKPVMARGISGTQFMTEEPVLRAMEEINTLLPAHNPPYVAAVRAFNQLYPVIPCIGTFETAFYDEVPPETYRYPVPLEWEEKYGIRRQGFHGASHRYVTQRTSELRGTTKDRLISCHLGGSSSLAAVKHGVAIDSSWGMTPQSGLPQNNRVGDFDVFAALYAIRDLGLGLDEVERVLGKESGLKGMSGLDTGDIRDIKEAALAGNENAHVALRVYTGAIRRFIGQFILQLNGLDVLVFTAGIGENNPDLRGQVCENLDFIGLKLDEEANLSAMGEEAVISAPDSRVEVRVIPTNEELIIARNAWRLLEENQNS